MDNNEILRQLIAQYELRHRDVVTLFTSDFGTISQKTVERWVSGGRNMPGPMLELLHYKIKDALDAQQSD